MKVIIVGHFFGYPNGDDKAPVEFVPSDKPVEVNDDFGALIVSKGLALEPNVEKPAAE